MINKLKLPNFSEPGIAEELGRSQEDFAQVPSSDWRVICWRIGVEYDLNYRWHDSVRSLVSNGLSRLPFSKNDNKSSQKFWALRGVSFALKKGDVLGLIGPNGAGKSTLIRQLCMIEEPDEGLVAVNGRIGALLNLTAGFKPKLSGLENIFLKGSLMGFSRKQVEDILPKILDLCELGDFIYAPVKSYSSGMRGRLGFSIAVNMMTDVIILDEVIGAGDERFKQRSGNIFSHIRDGEGERVLVVATHSLGLLKDICTSVLWLEKGMPQAYGPPEEVIEAYLESARAK